MDRHSCCNIFSPLLGNGVGPGGGGEGFCSPEKIVECCDFF